MNKKKVREVMTTQHMTLWRCDDGTYDICHDGEVIHCNVQEEVARKFVMHDELVAALQVLLHDADTRGYKLSDYAVHAARSALAKAQP